MSRRILFGVVVCVSFLVGLQEAPHLVAGGPWGTACNSGSTFCPTWQCAYRTTGGVNATCSTCGFRTPTGQVARCARSACGFCETTWFSYFCCQWTQCDGWDLDNNVSCICGVANYPAAGQPDNENWYCQRPQSLWTLFASW